MHKEIEVKQLLLLLGILIFVGCNYREQEVPDLNTQLVTTQLVTQKSTRVLEDSDPVWPDQELLLSCIVEWEDEKRELFSRYDPARDQWHSKKILSHFNEFDKDNILADDRHWIIASLVGMNTNSWPIHSYTLHHESGKIPIETDYDLHLIFVRIYLSNHQPDVYLIEQLCNECPSRYWTLDVKKCHSGECQLVDLPSDAISVTNWISLPRERYSDLSFDGEWRVDFEPVVNEPNQIILASSQPGSKQLLISNKDGFQKVVEYPEGISDCAGGWVFK
jgi:hypothetical protein